MSYHLIDDAEIRRRGITYTRQHRDRLIAAGQFPRPVKGAGKANKWLESEIDVYIAALLAKRDSRFKAA